MTRKAWEVELIVVKHPDEANARDWSPKRTRHKIELEHNSWTARRIIRVDGVRLEKRDLLSYDIFTQGSDDAFFLDGHSCLVHIRPAKHGLNYKYDLVIDGQSVQTGNEVFPRPEILERGLHGRISVWAWPFFPLVLFAAIIGDAMALSITHIDANNAIVRAAFALVVYLSFDRIVRIARDRSRSTKTRVAMCFGTVLLVGVVLFVVIFVGSFLLRLIGLV